MAHGSGSWVQRGQLAAVRSLIKSKIDVNAQAQNFNKAIA